MRYPIDVLYLDHANTVVHLIPNLQPWRFAPLRLQAASVLELPTHTIAQTETSLGDKIEIQLQEDIESTHSIRVRRTSRQSLPNYPDPLELPWKSGVRRFANQGL